MNVETKTHQKAIAFIICATIIFALQDAVTRMLVQEYHPAQFIMIRQWVFLAFALLYCYRTTGIANAIQTKQLGWQILRNLFWILELILFAFAVKVLQLAEIHALFAMFPLIVTLLAPIVLKEALGWRRLIAVIVGFIGALIIIRPGSGIFDIHAIYGILATLFFAFYQLLTRKVNQHDQFSTNFLYLALIAAVVSTAWGLPSWQPLDTKSMYLVAFICLTGLVSHVLLMKALEHAPASTLQPFNYLTVVWAVVFGYLFFTELPDFWTIIGSIIIVSSGLFVIMRERYLRRRNQL